jgi:hypothetical protein
VKISCGGLHLKEDCSRSNPSIALWPFLKVVASPRIVYGELRQSGSFEGGLFCMVGGSRQDPHLG